jgi:type II secretory pathway pseudopilin PulG
MTVVELLIITAIIIVLMGLLLPSVREAKLAATETRELSRLRQVMTACQNYALADNVWPQGSPLGDGNISALQANLRKYVQDSDIYKDPWNEHPLLYIHSNYYEAGTMETVGPPVDGPYNPTSFQLFSRGRDGRMSVQGFRPENDDNMWADIQNNRAVLFEQVRQGAGL